MATRVRRAITLDRESTPDPPATRMAVLTIEQIGPKRFMTPEGFLYCQDVPIARLGLMMYGPGETPITEGPDGLCWVSRDAAALFAESCIASFQGKDVVDEHPPDDVTPKNFRQLTEGVMLNVRPGSGDDADVLLADLLIKDEGMIRDIEANKREVSIGYEADYEQTGPGQGVQTAIIGNHVALVKRGRCGPRCAIGDQQPNLSTKEDETMATQAIRRSIPAKPRHKISQATLDAIAEMINQEDPDASTMDDGELSGKADGGTHIHIHGLGSTPAGSNGAVDVNDDGGEAGGAKPITGKADPYEARFVSVENGIKELTALVQGMVTAASGKGGAGGESTGDEETDPKVDKEDKEKKTDDEGNPFAKKDDEDKDDKKEKAKTGDSVALETGYAALVADAEILVPGFRVSTFDAKAQRSKTIDMMCNARRKALDTCYATADGKALLENVSGAKSLDLMSLDCGAVRTLFQAAAGAKKLLNNTRSTQDAQRMANPGNGQQQRTSTAPKSIAELNKQNREFYAAKQKGAKV